MDRRPRHILPIAVFLSVVLIVVPFSYGYSSSQSDNQSNIDTVSSSGEMIILLHGALKSAFSMKRLENMFADHGYQTLNWDYDSRNYAVEENAAKLDSIIKARNYEQYKLNFVTHSMGGIIVRYYLDKYTPSKLGRFVMIAPPNQGSLIANELQKFPPFRWLYKKNVDYLTTGSEAFAPNAGIPPMEFGIIAGGTGGKYGFNWYLPGDDDGTLSVEQTKLQGASDFILLPYIHATIMIQDRTLQQTLNFIQEGHFEHQQLTRADWPF